MADNHPYTLIVNGSGVIEQMIGTCGTEAQHCPGSQLASSITVVSNTVASGVRTVVMTRAFQGKTANHYTFDPMTQDTIPVITAVGSGPAFDYHKAHDATEISVIAGSGATCICDTGAAGQMCEPGGVNCAQFTKNCVAEPGGDLLAQRNPTCNSRQYVGGLTHCCTHQRILLDADQDPGDVMLRYHMKFRFWFQEYKVDSNGAASHLNLPRVYQQTEWNAGEYDIPPAFNVPGWHPAGGAPGYPGHPDGVPTPGTTCTGTCPNGTDCECVHTITAHWHMNARLIYAGGHCHAPSCLSLELFNADTGELICGQYPVYGKGNFPEDRYDEAGYIQIPPCLWSDDTSENLQPTKLINANVMSVARKRNTKTGHYGEMASWQMRAAEGGACYGCKDPPKVLSAPVTGPTI
jgi:hypothetical protein